MAERPNMTQAINSILGLGTNYAAGLMDSGLQQWSLKTQYSGHVSGRKGDCRVCSHDIMESTYSELHLEHLLFPPLLSFLFNHSLLLERNFIRLRKGGRLLDLLES